MTFVQAVQSALGSYATFSGRSRRSEYWWFYLFTIVVGIIATGIDTLLNAVFDNAVGVVGLVTSLAVLLPSWAVTVRRLHDTGRTGWWLLVPLMLLLALIAVAFAAVFVVVLNFGSGDEGLVTWLVTVPLIVLGPLTIASVITLLVFLCLDSKPGLNKYGPSPKEPTPPVGPYGYYPQAPYGPGPQTPPYQYP